MVTVDLDLLIPFAARYIWWKKPGEAVLMPMRVIAQVMNIGTPEDQDAIMGLVGLDGLREVVRRAEAGWFDERPWRVWHVRLGLAEEGEIPLLPVRRIPPFEI